MNKPVAWINRDDKEGWLQWDKNTNMPINIPLYTHPPQKPMMVLDGNRVYPTVKELTPCEELRAFQEQQNGVFSEHNACCYRHECRIVWNDWEKLRSNTVKELTDTEIVRISETCDLNHVLGLIDFARAILRKAQEK